jgi:electron transport complex protein RnfC
MTVIRKKGFTNGIWLDENKKSASSLIQIFKIPSRVIIPLQQHIGAECEPLVKKGDIVSEGQLIGDSSEAISAGIHASISGIVSGILKIINPATSTIINAIEIKAHENHETDINKNAHKTGEIREIRSPGTVDTPGTTDDILAAIDKIPAARLLETIKKSGIVGLGGAAFPTHIKLSPPAKINIDTLIINGCECEPYITSDHRLMLEYGYEVICGIYIISRILKTGNVLIAIEDNKEDAIINLENIIRSLELEKSFKIVSLPSKYPMGAEKVLIYNLLKRKVPVGSLPFEVGVVVNNVGTSKAVFDAVIKNRPLIERVITVTGDIERPVNLMVRIGTLLGDIVESVHVPEDKSLKLIFGGPMTGFSINNMDFPVTKAVNCILVKHVKKPVENNCIRCSRCVSACPMNLMPLMYASYVKNNRYDACREYYIENCIECGSCAFVCPASIPLLGYIKTGKSVLARKD